MLFRSGFAHGDFINRMSFVLLNTLVRRNSQSGSKRNIEAHYDVGNDFYQLWLDETMTYSSALFKEPEATLADAQRAKYARILEKFGTPRANVLEIGCGWGGFAESATASCATGNSIWAGAPPHSRSAARTSITWN